jgi:hypothetical protein
VSLFLRKKSPQSHLNKEEILTAFCQNNYIIFHKICLEIFLFIRAQFWATFCQKRLVTLEATGKKPTSFKIKFRRATLSQSIEIVHMPAERIDIQELDTKCIPLNQINPK